MNEKRAAARLGLATTEQKPEHGKVRTLDLEMDDGGRVVLTIMKNGAVAVQTFRASMSAKSLYRLEGTVILDPGFIREWVETLSLVGQSWGLAGPL
jgi:hypothetical protein